MSLVTPLSDASTDASTTMYAPQVTGLIAGEDLLICAPCYIKSSDGKAYMCNATANNEAAEFVGIAPWAAKAGLPVTLFGFGTRFRYAASLTPGDVLFIGATAGRYDTAATTGDTGGTLQVVSNNDVRVIRTKVAGG